MRKQNLKLMVCASAALLFLSLLPASKAHAQLTARGLGMGGAYTALARGAHAPSWNPANLGLPDNSRWSLTFFSVGARVRNNSFSQDLWDQYVVGDGSGVHWSQQDIEDILSHIPDGGFDADVGASVRAFSFSVGRFALSFGAEVGSFFRFDKSFLQMALQGNAVGERYNMNNTTGQALALGMVSVSWGQPVRVSFADVFSVGGTVHLLFPGGYGNVDRADGYLETTADGFDLDWDYEATYADLGKMGLGLDLGAAAQYGDKWTVSMSLANVMGSLSWSGNVDKQFGFGSGDSLTVFDLSVEEEGEEDAIIDSSWTLEDVGDFSDRMPAILRLGVSYREGPVLLSADYIQGFHDSAWIGTTPRFSVGTEYAGLSWLPLRMGVVLGGRMGFGTSFGLGLRPGGFVLDIGVMNRGFISPKSSKGVIVAVEMGIDLARKHSQ